MMSDNRICNLFSIRYPIIQAGMIWCSGWRLASAVSKKGGLGILGAGSMYPDVLREQIKKCKQALKGESFGVNLPLLYPDIESHIITILEEKVPIVFTSAGNPSTWTNHLKKEGIKVVHVVASTKFALKAEECGVDAIVAEGFEAGGHNGREETTTLCLIPLIRKAISIPLIAAGGIGSGRAMLAVMALGAEAVQIGSRFVATYESCAHEDFKQKVVEAGEGDTILTLKKVTPVRLIKNDFFNLIKEAESRGASPDELKIILGKARAKKGMFEGDMEEGELEIGQVSAGINNIMSAAEVIQEILIEYENARKELILKEIKIRD